MGIKKIIDVNNDRILIGKVDQGEFKKRKKEEVKMRRGFRL